MKETGVDVVPGSCKQPELAQPCLQHGPAGFETGLCNSNPTRMLEQQGRNSLIKACKLLSCAKACCPGFLAAG